MSRLDFQRDVLERSRTLPVVVDFWAPWCAPCRTLGPVIERLAAAADGRWALVKLNTDEHPDVAARFGIRGIPAVKMFNDGRVVAEFVGALPEAEIERWLKTSLPQPGVVELDTLMAGWEMRPPADLRGQLEVFVATHPGLPLGRARLAQALVFSDPQRARSLLREIAREAELMDLAGDIGSLADLMDAEADLPPQLLPHIQGARDRLAAHDLDAGLEHLIDAVGVDRKFGDDLARRAAVALFRLLGQGHELTQKHQRRLGMVLHS